MMRASWGKSTCEAVVISQKPPCGVIRFWWLWPLIQARTLRYVGDRLHTAIIYLAFQENYHWFAGILSALAAFGIMLLLSRQGFEAEEISDMRGLFQRRPWYALMSEPRFLANPSQVVRYHRSKIEIVRLSHALRRDY